MTNIAIGTANQDRLIGIALNDLTVAKEVITLPLHERYAPLLFAMRKAVDDNVLLNRQGLQNYLQMHQPQLTPSELAGATQMRDTLDTKILQTPFKQDEIPSLLQAVKAEKQQRQKLEAVTYIKDGNIQSAAKVLQEIIEPIDIQAAEADPFGQTVEIPLQRERLPAPITDIMDYLAEKTSDKANIKHLICAAAILASAMGKRVVFENWGTDYYTNFAAVCLDQTGANKTGLYNTIDRLVKDLLCSNTVSTATLEAFVEKYCEYLPVDRKRSKEETRRLIKDIYAKHAADKKGELVLIDEFRAFLLTLVPQEQSIRNGQVFCRLLDAAPVEMSTITSGNRILGSTAFTFLGFSQADPWNTEVRNVAQQTGGMAGRIIPINSARVALSQYIAEPADDQKCKDWITAVANPQPPAADSSAENPFSEALFTPADGSPDTITIYFGNDGTDWLGNTKAWFADQPIVQYAIKNNPHTYDLVVPKILIQAAKLAAILAVADATAKNALTAFIDAKRWLKAAFSIVGYAHLTNMYHVATMSEQGEKIEKVLELIRRKQKDGITKRDLVKFANMRSMDVANILDLLGTAGDIVKTRKGKSDLYYLRK